MNSTYQADDIVFVTASHNETVLNANLKQSPVIADGRIPLEVVTGARSAATAYNRGLDATTAEIVVFVHHDVYIPEGWDEILLERIVEVERDDPNWGLLGPHGITWEGAHYGPVWSTSIGLILGRVPTRPVAVHSYDELMLILRRGTGLRFDEGLPNFHLYGTDITQTALAEGFGCYTAPMPLVHNDGFHDVLGQDFQDCFSYIQKKWRHKLPIKASVTEITRSGIKHMRSSRRARKSREFRKAMALSTDVHPLVYASRCGWATLKSPQNPQP